MTALEALISPQTAAAARALVAPTPDSQEPQSDAQGPGTATAGPQRST